MQRVKDMTPAERANVLDSLAKVVEPATVRGAIIVLADHTRNLGRDLLTLCTCIEILGHNLHIAYDDAEAVKGMLSRLETIVSTDGAEPEAPAQPS